jgi:hypothetical protein
MLVGIADCPPFCLPARLVAQPTAARALRCHLGAKVAEQLAGIGQGDTAAALQHAKRAKRQGGIGRSRHGPASSTTAQAGAPNM